MPTMDLASRLAKAAMLMALMLAEYAAFIPPNQAPSREERLRYGRHSDPLAFVGTWLPQLGVVTWWLIHLLEFTSLVLSSNYSSGSSNFFSTLFSSRFAISITPVFILGSVLLITGAAIRKACYVYLGRMFTVQLAVLKEHKLVTSGPYSLVRHPSYTGFILATNGLMLVLLCPGSYIVERGLLDFSWSKAVVGMGVMMGVLLQLVAIRRTAKEDEVLKKEFGKTWDEWAKRTPYRLVPYLY